MKLKCCDCPDLFDQPMGRPGPSPKRCPACRAIHDRENNRRDQQRRRQKVPQLKTTKKRGPIGYAGKYTR